MSSCSNLKNIRIRPKSKGIAIRNKKSNNNKREDSYDSVYLINNENNISKIKNNKIKREELKLVNEITILVNLYFMEINIKSSFSDLNKNDKNKKFYLINKSFIKNFKKNFKYEYIQSHLINVKEKNDNLIKDIIFQLSINNFYTDQIKMNKNIAITHKNKYFFKNINNKSFKLLIKYEIISDLLYALFKKRNYLNCDLEEVNVYNLFDNKILVK